MPIPLLQGKLDAIYALGMMAMGGKSLPRNYTLAALAFEEGAALGHADSTLWLADLYTRMPCLPS